MNRFSLIISMSIFLLLSTIPAQAQKLRTMTTQAFLEELEQKDAGTILVNFWATWCGPCVEELPFFNQLAREYADEGVEFMFVSLDFKEAPLLKFLEINEFEGEVIFLSDGLRDPDWIEQMDPTWSGAIPATLALNFETEAKAFHEGSFTYEELLAWLSPAFISSN